MPSTMSPFQGQSNFGNFSTGASPCAMLSCPFRALYKCAFCPFYLAKIGLFTKKIKTRPRVHALKTAFCRFSYKANALFCAIKGT